MLSLESAAERLTQIQGMVPSPADFPAGLPFRRPLPDGDGGVPYDGPRSAWAPRRHSAACHHPAIDLPTPEPTGSETVK